MKKSLGFGKSATSLSKAVALAIGLVALTPFLIPYIYQFQNVTKLKKELNADFFLHFNDSADKGNFVLHIGPASKYGTMIVLEEMLCDWSIDVGFILFLIVFIVFFPPSYPFLLQRQAPQQSKLKSTVTN